jgi:hypothetical protein
MQKLIKIPNNFVVRLFSNSSIKHKRDRIKPTYPSRSREAHPLVGAVGPKGALTIRAINCQESKSCKKWLV